MLSDLRFRLRALFRRGAMDLELDEELRFHIEREMEKHVRAGVPREEAARRARLAFGGVSRIADDARDARGITLLDSLMQDVRYAARGLRSKPGFTAAVVLTLGLGVGANTAMFGIVDRLMLRPPAYLATPERVYRPFLSYWLPGEERVDRVLEYRRYLDLTQWTSSFDRTAVLALRSLAVGSGDEAREMTVAAISASTFDFFEARPVIGRFFTAEEDRPPLGAPVAVISHGLWQSRFGARQDVLGASLHIASTIYTVIGVAPEGFVGFAEQRTPVAFVPVTAVAGARNTSYYRSYQWSWLEMFVRRRPGVSLARANADLASAYLRSWEAERAIARLPDAASAKPRAELASLHLGRTPDASADAKTLVWVMGVAVIVLLIACANVANLLLARALRRRREIALRLALGVSRPRLLQQLLVEGLLLATLGGALGLMVAQWGGGTVRALFLRPEDAGTVVTDGRTLLFAVLVTALVALVTGVAPALHALRADVASALKAGSREGSYRRSRVRSGLLLFQAALSVVLLVGAGLFSRSLWNVRALWLGYDVAPIAYVEANLRGARLSDAELLALTQRMLAAATRVPGVERASLTVSVPFWSNEGYGLHVPGVDSVRKLGRFLLQAGSPDYFATIGTRILRGRGFTDADLAGTELVAVVSAGMARVLWPDQEAIGRQFRIGSDTAAFTRVIGIAEDIRARTIAGEREYWYYLPLAQFAATVGTPYPTLFARVHGAPEDHIEALRRAVQAELPGAGYVNVLPLRALVAPNQRSWEFGATMFVAFGALALVLAAIGLYSVIAYAVAGRTQELGVRIALGASIGNVTRMVVGQGVLFAIAGIVIGGALALLAGRWVQPLLFEQSANDPTVFGTVAAVLLVVAVGAALRPALRAARVDPTVALRSD